MNPVLETLVRSRPARLQAVCRRQGALRADSRREPAAPARPRSQRQANGASTSVEIAESHARGTPTAGRSRPRPAPGRTCSPRSPSPRRARASAKAAARRSRAVSLRTIRATARYPRYSVTRCRSPLDTLGRPVRDLRISVTDRCNFRCTYCMPKEVFGRGYRFLDRKELLELRGDHAASRGRSSRSASRRSGSRRRAARTPRSRAADRDAAQARRPRPHADDERRRCCPEGAGAHRRPASQRITVSLDSLDDATFRAMNDVDFPVEPRARGHRRRRRAGLAVKVNSSSSAA